MFEKSNLTSSLVAFTFLLLLIYSCDDSDSSLVLNGTKADIEAMLRSEDITQRATIDSDNFRFVSNKGVEVTASPNSFISAKDGSPVTGMIDFEMTELFSKSEILRYGIPTQTADAILESDGEFLFEASQNDEALRMASDFALNVSVPNGDPNPDMETFWEAEGLWWPLSTSLTTSVADSSGFSGYTFGTNRLSWINIDYFLKFDLELTDVEVCLPEEYENEGYILWFVFRDRDVVLSGVGQNLPIGEVVSIVCIAAENEESFLIDIEEVTIEDNLKVNLEPKRASIERIIELLKELD